MIIYGAMLYSPALMPDFDESSTEDVRMELMNSTKGAIIGQNFDIPQYNIGYDMLNLGGILLLVGMLFYNYIETTTLKKEKVKPSKYLYKLHGNGLFRGNILEWFCVILFLFAFITYFNSVFFYIVLTSLTLGIVGYSIRVLHIKALLKKSY